jgi:hypothetical protein
MDMEQTECSEMSAYKIQRPGNYPEENIQESDYIIPPADDYFKAHGSCPEIFISF